MNRQHSHRQGTGTVDVIVIGAGHCGLAMSRLLSLRGIEHVVLERGQVANSWRTERWDSLRLLTPNWMTRLPGQAYDGDDADGYMSAGEVGNFISSYATRTAAPVLANTAVLAVEPAGDRYRVTTTQGEFLARAVVVATGACNQPIVPAVASGLPAAVQQRTAHSYRNPGQLTEGRVLVVGASATGLQLAAEIARSGREVTLAVGEHVRMPRLYRGRDIQWWMLASGVLDQRIDEADDAERARRVASPQLVGTPERATLDLNSLQQEGVEIVGRLVGVRDGKAQFSGSLRNVCSLADLKMNRLLDLADAYAESAGLGHQVGPVERYTPTQVGTPRLMRSLGDDIESVVWATGFRPTYPWLKVDTLDRSGELEHQGGVLKAPGLYALGLPFLRRRKSSFIHGAEDDARDLAAHLAGYLDQTTRASTRGTDRVCV